MISMTSTRTNEEWLYDLTVGGEAQESAISDLRDLLLRAVLFFFSRNLGDFEKLSRSETLQLAEDCAQDALIAVMNHLSDFRGDSKFTTWAYKFAINMALMTARRERRKGVSVEQLFSTEDGASFEWTFEDNSSENMPDQSTMQGEIRDIIQHVINHDLTDRQRRVLLMMVFHDVPMDVVVRELDTNRNAIYKILHDARRKLKQRLQAHGFEVGEILALFTAQR
jgi:RNA polymerase sigma-70 factor (ECF subfamily)